MSNNDRRRFLSQVLVAGGATLLAGCDKLVNSDGFTGLLHGVDGMTDKTFHAITPEYLSLTANNFADYRLAIGGLVKTPLNLSVEQLRAMPSRTQITRHDCVEGWSCIGKWKGTPLAHLIDTAGALPSAKYVVFRCADSIDNDDNRYYESIYLREAYHPQTIIAYDMNDAPLTIPHGAPLRLRVERKLGYKQAKYILAIDLVDSLAGLGKGKGGYWEDDQGYQWHGGI